jgi:hypothetical protein
VSSQALRAHAALSPWQGQNALDAAVAAYTNVSLLRQQVKPSHRIHGVFEGKDWAANSERLSDFSDSLLNLDSSHPRQCKNAVSVALCDGLALLKMDSWYVRAPTIAEVKDADPRVRACFQ